MTDFDVILGMDWLGLCHATLDCYFKSVELSIPVEPVFVFQGDRSEVPYNLISMISARRMLSKGCRGFLALLGVLKRIWRALITYWW